MSQATPFTGPFCSALGCREGADFLAEHPEHGERVVCEDHVKGEVIRRVQ